ncbi:methyltransferase domain-containing protein, partial [bacterium]|nr:methyltransferase domain-containing protein [bacterium]
EIFTRNELKGKFDVGDVNNLPYDSGSFDLVFSIGLLEHFENIETPLREQVRILDKGGLFIGYVVPKYENNIQSGFEWINEILRGYLKEDALDQCEKEQVFRSDLDSSHYLPVLEKLGLSDVQTSGVYPLPMISHSTEFPFTLMSPESESSLVRQLEIMLKQNAEKSGRHQWLCEEGIGQAFLIWGFKR